MDQLTLAIRTIGHVLLESSRETWRYGRSTINYLKHRYQSSGTPTDTIQYLNLCCGPQRVPGYLGIDVAEPADLRIDLNFFGLPIASNTALGVAWISGINYFSQTRARELLTEVKRVLHGGGILRLGTQDLDLIARHYVARNDGFFYQRSLDGSERFEGRTLGDKFVSWFYGYKASGYPCRYFYDFNSLSTMLADVGFSEIRRCAFQESSLPSIELLDNRPEQMFFVEAKKPIPHEPRS